MTLIYRYDLSAAFTELSGEHQIHKLHSATEMPAHKIVCHELCLCCAGPHNAQAH